MEQVYDPIPKNLTEEYAILKTALTTIAGGKGADYHVEDWRPSYFATPFDQKKLTMGKTYHLHTFAGYRIEQGNGLAEDDWKRSVLLASFDKPERHRLPRPESAGDGYHLLAISFDKDHFTRSALETALEEAFPNYDLHFDERG